MFNTAKRKHDEIPRDWSWSTWLKFMLGVLILGLIVHTFLAQRGDPWSIKETPDAAALDKIYALRNQAAAVPEFVSVSFDRATASPICASVDMKVLEDARAEDLITWSEMWFNDRRLSPEDVTITIHDVETFWGPHIGNGVFEKRSALELCFNHGPIIYGQPHLLRISVHDSFVHEILSYEWAFTYIRG